MNIKLDNYYVTRGLNVVLAKDNKIRNDQTRMINPDYFKNINWFGVYKEGNYYSDKSRSHKDIMEELTNTSIKNDLYILDLFQLADYTMDMLYTTANDRSKNIRINNDHGSKISIYHKAINETYKYPIVSANGATHTANKISRLHKALKGF